MSDRIKSPPEDFGVEAERSADFDSKIKSHIPIIQARRDRFMSVEVQRETVKKLEQNMAKDLECFRSGVAGLKELGFDPKAVFVEYSFVVDAFSHAFSRVVHEERFAVVSLTELVSSVEEVYDYVRDHALEPQISAPWIRFRRIDLQQPLAEVNKEKAWSEQVGGGDRPFLEKLFGALKSFMPISKRGGNGSYVVSFAWQQLSEIGVAKKTIKLVTNEFSDFPDLQTFLEDPRNLVEQKNRNIVRVVSVDNVSAPSIRERSRNIVDLPGRLAEIDTSDFFQKFEEEYGEPEIVNAMTSVELREFIKKIFAESFEFYPELNQKLTDLIPDNQRPDENKIQAILKKLFEGIIF